MKYKVWDTVVIIPYTKEIKRWSFFYESEEKYWWSKIVIESIIEVLPFPYATNWFFFSDTMIDHKATARLKEEDSMDLLMNNEAVRLAREDWLTVTYKSWQLYTVSRPSLEAWPPIEDNKEIQEFESILKEMLETVKKKNADYAGDWDFFENFIRSAEATWMKVGQTFMYEKSKKMTRVKNLLKKESQVWESCIDSLMDDAVYSILMMIWLNRQDKLWLEK